MKLLVCATLVLSSFAVSPTVVVAGTQLAATCGPDVPEAMKRPGGYCDLIQSTDNIGTERNKGSAPCVKGASFPLLRKGITVQVAVIRCCRDIGEATMPLTLPADLLSRTDVIEVAGEDPCQYQ